MTRRVVVTGIGANSPIGASMAAIGDALQQQRSGIRIQDSWREFEGLFTRLGAPVSEVNLDFNKSETRTMGRVAQLALRATLDALDDSGLVEDQWQSGRCGLAYGSTQGSSEALVNFATKLVKANGGLRGFRPTTYIQFMTHTCAANLAMYLGVRGRIIPTCSACTSGSQGIGYGYESIKYGLQDIMIAGGAEELHYTHTGVFDRLRATSTKYNDDPESTPRPFDADRDGLVVGEGAVTFVLEELEHATARGANIYCEVLGYGTTCDGMHMTSPDAPGMATAMNAALKDAAIDAGHVDYVNAHATATLVGDVAESKATFEIFGAQTPVSSTKGLTGHTLGAAGSLESLICVIALQQAMIPANSNLEKVDPQCATLDYVREPRAQKLTTVMNNNFAFGGVNTSLIFRTL